MKNNNNELKQKKTDLRKRQTYTFLKIALFELLRNKPFIEISVTDICQKAIVHRTTFYKHFEDKDHLLRTIIAELQQQFDEHCSQNMNIKENPKTFYLYLFERLLEYISSNKAFMSKIILDKSNNYIEEIFKNSLSEYIENHLKMTEKLYSVKFKLNHSLMAEYYTSATIAMSNWWLENNMNIPIENMVKYLDILVSGNILENKNYLLLDKI